MTNCGPRPTAIAGVHNCKRCQKGYKTCYIHRWNSLTVRTNFSKMMIELFSVDERRSLHEAMNSAMLEISKTQIPLDQLSQAYIDKNISVPGGRDNV
jgi:hypothetical protein